ncbi:E2F/DP family winged-helix DNA-binding domain [Carpediemonas membranifera]|uniref:E2F/DP family winged-helix DNA-binding domain n=1 Tax=Carpediemonas membranifera TaxID=201153 RepID=A0A8J6B1J8_9EUKA|nr:E2F/DP family winged-helix DNA-binding domain [Carpediemonas membranifera]|eukprot:KAG9390959.1 E2F/DP family winged-helix DNA-binding domain [Carpediemonas membranifera]
MLVTEFAKFWRSTGVFLSQTFVQTRYIIIQIIRTLVEEINAAKVGEEVLLTDKNLQRRIYDALNVFTSLGYAQKDSREITWLLDSGHASLPLSADSEADAIKRRIKERRKELEDIKRQHNMLRWVSDYAMTDFVTQSDDNLALPFMVVVFPPSAEAHIDLSADRKQCMMKMKHRCWIYDDNEIIQAIMDRAMASQPLDQDGTI